MKKIRYVLAVLVMLLAGSITSKAEAEIKITIKNSRSHTMSFAFCWAGVHDYRRSGWYNVESGKSRTISIKDAYYPATSTEFGYYAKGGGSVWRGDLMQVIIHPNKSFSGEIDDHISGGQTVGFRKVNLKRVGDVDGSATLTFNP